MSAPDHERLRGDLSALAPKTRAKVVSEHEVLLALADRCEREGPSEELDREIAKAAGWKVNPRHAIFCWIRPDGKYVMGVLPFTTSLDAAVSLVPEGCSITISIPGAYAGGHYAMLCLPMQGPIPPRHTGKASTTPLSLCAASLRARASISKAKGE